MIRIATLFALTLFATPLFAQEKVETAPDKADNSAEFKSLFNGKDLTGWDGDPRLWSVKDGAIHGETTKKNPTKGNTFLIWQDGTLKNFELKLSFRCNAVNNSGIMYRSSLVEKGSNDWVLKGYQYEIRNEENFPNVPGFIYDERGSRGRICLVGQKAVWDKNGKTVLADDLIDQEDFKKLMKIDDWNDVTIIARGNHIQHYLNGKLLLDFTDKDPKKALSKGVLGLQLHGGHPMWTEIKNIRLREFE